MKRYSISREELEILYGKMIDEKDLSIYGYKDKFHFEIYDGFAYCPNYHGSDYALIYPKIEFADKSDEIKAAVRKFMNIPDDEPISVYDLMQTFNELIVNNKRMCYNENKKKYEYKKMWLV